MIAALRQTGATETEVDEVERMDDDQAAEILAKTFTHLHEAGALAMMLKAAKGQKGQALRRRLAEKDDG